ncbi:MAG: InlB B-repeat-containing protein, partial [Firmicutes bacterium]|nr:InlB B-repeat-containing protein [Bacillota bacterium]
SGSVLAGIVGSFSNCPNLTVYIDDASRYGPYNSVNYYWPDSPVLWNCTTAEDENGVYVESFIKKSSSGIRFPSENFNAPYRKGYIFGGWSAVPGGPKVYSAAQLAASFLSIANNTTLYAIWIEK